MGANRRKAFLKELRGAFVLTDLVSGLPDAILACLLFTAFFGSLYQLPNTEEIRVYVQYWFAWEILAVATLPSLIWIFEKRGPEDPRSIDVPRPVRVLLPLAFLFMIANFDPSKVVRILSHIAPLILLKSIVFLVRSPMYRTFMKACRRVGFTLLFFIIVGIPYAFIISATRIPELQIDPGFGSLLFGGIFYGSFAVIEIVAEPCRRVLSLDEEDKKHAF